MIFPTFAAIASKLSHKLKSLNPSVSRIHQDIDWEIRVDNLIEALYNCGIPLWIAKRNARAFMVLCPEFDLNSSKYSKVRKLLEWHQEEFLGAYFDIAEQQGKQAADQWMQWIRDNDIFFARICQLPSDPTLQYLFA